MGGGSVTAAEAPGAAEGRAGPWVDDRATLNGMLYVLRSGIPWRMLPTEATVFLGFLAFYVLDLVT